MSSPKRPAPPAPDPNWELELHGPAPGDVRPPESRDELLAHAVLREPQPLDLIDDFKEPERVTIPPPAGMADHVARMMAEAAALEEDDDDGDRPTPLREVETVEVPVPKLAAPPLVPRDPGPAARLPAREPAVTPRDPAPKGATRDVGQSVPRDVRQSVPRDVRQSVPRDVRQSVPRDVRQSVPRDVRQSVPRDVRQSVPRDVRQSVPRDVRQSVPRDVRQSVPRDVGQSVPRDVRQSVPRDARSPLASSPAGLPPAREPPPIRASPLPFEAVRPPEPAPRRAMTPPPFGAVRPAERPAARKPTPPPFEAARPVERTPIRRPTPAPVRTPTPAPVRTSTPAPFAIRQRDPAPAKEERRISSLDFDDLPAVFGLGLEGLSLDDLTSELSVKSAVATAPEGAPPGVPSSDPVISPSLALPPSSAPAISPPFGSLDPVELPDELGWGEPDLPATPPPQATPPPDDPPPETIAAIDARLAAGDYGRALMLAEAALEAHPGHPALVSSADICRDELYRTYLERLGAADHVPRLAVNGGALTGLALDHRAGFLLSCVDGGSTVEEIIDVSAMPRLEAVRVLYELLQEGIIEMTSRR